MKKTFFSLLRWVRSWRNKHLLLDGLFALLERSHAGLKQLLRRGQSLRRATRLRPRPNYQPQVEGLEPRLVMTGVNFQSGAVSVAYNDTANVVVQLDGSSSNTITVDYATSDDTAISGTDYQGGTGTLTFNPGTTSETISVNTLDFPETTNPDFFISLSNPCGAVLGSDDTPQDTACATVTI